MKTIEVIGSPTEMGRKQGEATAENWLAKTEGVSRIRIPETFQKDIEEFCPRQFERLIGIAMGAAASVETVLASLFVEVMDAQADYYLGACSAVAVRGKALSSGGPVIAKNRDGGKDASRAIFARISRPSDAFHSIEVTSGTSAGSHDGVNEKGLAVSMNFGHSIDLPERFVPLSLVVQEVLERCESVEQAIQLFEQTPRAYGALIMLADAGGDVASLEISPHHFGIRRPDSDRIAHTNHFQTPDMAAIDIPREAYYSDKMPSGLRGMRIRESSEKRYERITRILSETTVFSEQSLIGLLTDHDEDGIPDDNTICRHGGFFTTACSMLMFPAERAIKAAIGNPCKRSYKLVSLL